MGDSIGEAEEARSRAIRLIQQKFGSLADLSPDLLPVVWVTVYRSCEVGMHMEREGPNALLKAALVGGPVSGFDMEMAIRRLEFLGDMIKAIRENKSERERQADALLLIDILKWGISNAVELSGIRRFIARKFARADRLYAEQVPNEIL